MPRSHALLILLVGFLSGAVALAYEIIWTRQLLNLFGSTTTATATMLAAFMGGIALGSWLMGRWSKVLRRPLLIYASVEVALAMFGLMSSSIIEVVAEAIPSQAIDATPSRDMHKIPLRALGHLVVLLLPTAMMGATLPVLAKYYRGPASHCRSRHRR